MTTLTENTHNPRIQAALKAMRHAYPLERRIRNEACDDTRETYLAVLLHWMQNNTAPAAAYFDPDALEELAALDAVFIENGLTGCPPFHMAVTDIKVHCRHQTLYVLSALDALALPRLLNAPATIETRCAISGEPLRISLEESGSPLVAFRKIADMVNRYRYDLAPGIRFVLPCYGKTAQTLTLTEAVDAAYAFYAFQQALLNDEG